jgi:hypothetical protein
MEPEFSKKLPTFYGTRSFIAAFKTVRHLVLPEPELEKAESFLRIQQEENKN